MPTTVIAMPAVMRTSGGVIPAGRSATDPSTHRATVPATSSASGAASGRMYVTSLPLSALKPINGSTTATTSSARRSPPRMKPHARAGDMLNHGSIIMAVAGNSPPRNAGSRIHHGSS